MNGAKGTENRKWCESHDDDTLTPLNARTVVVKSDGSISYKIRELPQQRESKLPEIVEKLATTTVSALEVTDLIAIEIAQIIEDIGSCDLESDSFFRMSRYAMQIEALRTLARILRQTDRLAKQEILNMDGPKFELVFDKIIVYLFKITDEAFSHNYTIGQSVKKHYLDILAMNEPNLRRQILKVGTQKTK